MRVRPAAVVELDDGGEDARDSVGAERDAVGLPDAPQRLARGDGGVLVGEGEEAGVRLGAQTRDLESKQFLVSVFRGNIILRLKIWERGCGGHGGKKWNFQVIPHLACKNFFSLHNSRGHCNHILPLPKSAKVASGACATFFFFLKAAGYRRGGFQIKTAKKS